MPSNARFALGLDVDPGHVTAVLVDLGSGRVAGEARVACADGPITADTAAGRKLGLGASAAIQDPEAYLAAARKAIAAASRQAKARPDRVVGIGVASASCTLLPTTADGTPLCNLRRLRGQAHAYAKLPTHRAQAQADRINQLAAARGEGWPKRFGGSVPADWFLPKALEILERAPDVYRSADVLIEAGEWLVWKLTGQLVRSTCQGGYKHCWSRRHGYPSREFLGNLSPEFANLVENKLKGPRAAPGTLAGRLTKPMAKLLGLAEGAAVSSAIINTHAAVPGCGIAGPGELCLVLDASATHLLMAPHEQFINGIAGVVEDGILPGFFGYEAGQASVGSTLDWLGALVGSVGNGRTGRGPTPAEQLRCQAEALPPGAGGLLALDWLAGCRTPYADANLSGALFGLTLRTSAAQLYRALLEATAFGARRVTETLEQAGVSVGEVVVTGPQARENPLLVQVLADVLARPIRVAGSEQPSALGAAILGSLAAGPDVGGMDKPETAVRKLAPRPARVVKPQPAAQDAYRALYDDYRRLSSAFGRYEIPTLRNLRKLAVAAP